MDCLEYQKDFEKRRAKLKLPEDCEEIEPTVESVGFYFWSFLWFLIFKDGHYVRVWERWEKRKGLEDARRLNFAYHYGPIATRDKDGIPRAQPQDPVHIRIDNSCQPYHLHYGAPNPHYGQQQIDGLQLDALDLFRFVKAIIEHRGKKASLDKVLGFKIIE